MREEEKGTTTASTLPSFENHVAVEFRTKRLMEVLELSYKEITEHKLECCNHMPSYLNLLFHPQNIFTCVIINVYVQPFTNESGPFLYFFLKFIAWRQFFNIFFVQIIATFLLDLFVFYIFSFYLRPFVEVFDLNLLHGQSTATVTYIK
jgi:hypothetical protein